MSADAGERRYRRAHLSELPALASDLVEGEWKPVRFHLGISAFGTNAYVAREGEVVVGEHDEASSGHEELYLVLEGEARFTVEGDTFDARPGTFVFCPPAVSRRAVAGSGGATVLAIGGHPGQAFAVPRWESSEIAQR